AAVAMLGARFYTLVVAADTPLPLADLTSALKAIEAACGRREQKVPGRITLDIDILLYGELSGCHGGVQLPRPEINHNAFVLWPLTLLAPELVLPGTNTSCAALWQGWRGQQKVWPVAFDWHGQPLTPALLLRQYPAQSSPAPGSGADCGQFQCVLSRRSAGALQLALPGWRAPARPPGLPAPLHRAGARRSRQYSVIRCSRSFSISAPSAAPLNPCSSNILTSAERAALAAPRR